MAEKAEVTWLSIDPGSRTTAVWAWDGDRPHTSMPLHCPDKMAVEDRLKTILANVRLFGRYWKVEAVAIERPFRDPDRPAFELQVTYKRLCRVARDEGWKIYEYPASTVASQVAPRGFPAKTTEQRKAAIRAGVTAEYPEQTKNLDPEKEQDLFDSIGVGITHVNKTRAAKLTCEAS